jgi:Rha family phage regulatory protein
VNDLVMIQDQTLVTTSKIVADVFGKSHRNITRAIENLECSDSFRNANYGTSSYISPQNKKFNCITMTRDGFMMAVMGLTGKKACQVKEAYISVFNEMEKGLLNVDKRIQQLSIEGKEITEAGQNWSRVGHAIRKMKKGHVEKLKQLMSDVQMKLEF